MTRSSRALSTTKSMSLKYEPASEPLHISRPNNLLVRIHLISVMIRWTGLAPWEFEFARLQILEGHIDEIFSCAFNYEGDTIITGSKP